jgi:hypothetical protein
MSTAEQCGAATRRPEAYATLLGKLLAAAIIATPLVAMSFPQISHCWQDNATPHRRALEPRGAAAQAGEAKGLVGPDGSLRLQ